ncbi:hypothetical protein ES703_64263 [subsurface metagenome]
MKVLDEFGFGSVKLKLEDFENPDKVVQLGVPPVRVDILTSITGVSWEDEISGCVEDKYGDVLVKYIGLNDFIINKRAIGRKRDLSDLEALGEE